MGELVLSSTGEIILDSADTLANFTFDHSGNVALDIEVLRKALYRIVKALNADQEVLHRVRDTVDTIEIDVQGLKERSTESVDRVVDCQKKVTDVSLDINKIFAKLEIFDRRLKQEEAMEEQMNSPSNKATTKELRELRELVAEMGHRLDTTERFQKDEAKQVYNKMLECEQGLERHSSVLTQEIKSRLREADEAVLSLRLDLEAAQVTLQESNKVTRAEVVEMQKRIAKVMDTVHNDHKTLEEAAANLKKLDECVELGIANRNRTEEVWQVFMKDSKEMREWASKSFSELGKNLQGKMETRTAQDQWTDLDARVKGSTAHLAEGMARLEAVLRKKAEVGDMDRLQDQVRDICNVNTKTTRQLLVGTKCLACDRTMTADEVTPENVIDLAKEKQQQDLFQEVQRVLNKQPGTADNVIKYVAVRVGSPGRTNNGFDIRDEQDVGGHALVRAAPRLGSSQGRRPNTSDLPARAPPREVPPLVRVMPRRKGHTPRGGVALPGATHGSLRSALGPMPPPRSSRVQSGFPMPAPPVPETPAEVELTPAVQQQLDSREFDSRTSSAVFHAEEEVLPPPRERSNSLSSFHNAPDHQRPAITMQPGARR